MKRILMALMAVAVLVTFSAPSFAMGEKKDKKKEGGHLILEEKKDKKKEGGHLYFGEKKKKDEGKLFEEKKEKKGK